MQSRALSWRACFQRGQKTRAPHAIQVLPGTPAYGPRIKVAFDPTDRLTGVATEATGRLEITHGQAADAAAMSGSGVRGPGRSFRPLSKTDSMRGSENDDRERDL